MSLSVIRGVLSIGRQKTYLRKHVFSSSRTLVTTDCSHPNVLKSELSDVVVPDWTICEMLYPKLELYHKYTAVECASSGKSYTFGQIRMKSRNFSKALKEKLKLKKGDIVAILVKNIPEFGIAAYGIFEAGLVVTTLNPAYTPDEIKKQLLDSGARAIITQASDFCKVKSALEIMHSQIPIIVIKEKQADSIPSGAIDFFEFADTVINVPDIEPGHTSDLAFLPYSSGTTGLPKGVELTHNNIVSNIFQFNHKDVSFLNPPTDNFQDVIPTVLPLYHIYGFTAGTVNSAYNGTKSVTLDKFSPELFITVLKNHRVTVIYAAPPLILFLTSHQDVKKEYFKYVKMVISGGAPLGCLDEQRFTDKVGSHVTITQAYGLTETSPLVTWFPKTYAKNENGGCIGKVVPKTYVKIIAPDDPTGTPLGMNQSGELLVKGPQVMRGYYNRPEETEKSFLNGWFRTGDLGHFNDEGCMFITDRLKELIKVKGFQVAPAELEELIRSFPGVDDAAVIGIPNQAHGEVPRAYVVPKEGFALNVEEIKEYVAIKVTKYKQLAGGVQIVDTIPKNPSGKILRRLLKQNYKEKGI
ncbi:unnamed protein product [Phaedon cochleariae]|uniref:Uncharacterized protein n=1 Tax=Phaedon cochleariae TaxID=80249 RepID=A0A9N9SLL4_PHACE|nr:unnamed protein product [Phaedon cochleariae]